LALTISRTKAVGLAERRPIYGWTLGTWRTRNADLATAAAHVQSSDDRADLVRTYADRCEREKCPEDIAGAVLQEIHSSATQALGGRVVGPPPLGPAPAPPGGSTPPPGGSTPPPNGSTPPPGGSTPPPGGSTPPPDGSTPPPGGSTPPPNGSTRPRGKVVQVWTIERWASIVETLRNDVIQAARRGAPTDTYWGRYYELADDHNVPQEIVERVLDDIAAAVRAEQLAARPTPPPAGSTPPPGGSTPPPGGSTPPPGGSAPPEPAGGSTPPPGGSPPPEPAAGPPSQKPVAGDLPVGAILDIRAWSNKGFIGQASGRFRAAGAPELRVDSVSVLDLVLNWASRRFDIRVTVMEPYTAQAAFVKVHQMLRDAGFETFEIEYLFHSGTRSAERTDGSRSGEHETPEATPKEGGGSTPPPGGSTPPPGGSTPPPGGSTPPPGGSTPPSNKTLQAAAAILGALALFGGSGK